MKKNLFLLILLIIFTNFACSNIKTVPASSQADSFAAMSNHLDLGGDVYGYIDMKGDMKENAQFINELLSKVDNKIIPKKVKSKIDMVKIFEALGLNKLEAIGISSVKVDDRYINKTFIKIDGPPTGYLGVMGDTALPFETPALAPKTAALVIEENIRLKTLIKTIKTITFKFLPKNERKDIKKALKAPISEGLFSLNDLIKQSDTKVMVILDVNSSKSINVLDGSMEFSQFDLLISIDNMGFIMDDIITQLGFAPFLKFSKNDNWQTIEITEELPGDLSYYKPIIRRDMSNDRLYFATRLQFLNDCLNNNDPLENDPAFINTMNQLGINEGTSLAYSSPDFNKFIKSIFGNISKQKQDLKFVENIINYLLPDSDKPELALSTVTKDGLYGVSSSKFSHKFTLGYLGTMIPIYAGAAAAYIATEHASDDCNYPEITNQDCPQCPETVPQEVPDAPIEQK